VLSLLGMVLYQCLAYYAAHSTSATNMGVIGSLLPLLTLLQGALFFGQRPGRQALLGMSLSLFGVFWLLGQGEPLALLHTGINPGDGMMLLGAASYALYGLLIRRWQLPFGPWLNLYLQILLAVLLLVPVALSAESLAVPREGWGMVLFAGIASSLFAAYCWMRSLASLGPERTSVFMNLMPLCTALIAVITLGEPIHGYHGRGLRRARTRPTEKGAQAPFSVLSCVARVQACEPLGSVAAPPVVAPLRATALAIVEIHVQLVLGLQKLQIAARRSAAE